MLALLFRFVLPRLELRRDEARRRPFCTAGAFLFIFCCYVPVFLIEYPGSFAYDSMAQAHQISGNAYSSFHPLLHTLLIRFCISFLDVFGSMEKCGALYSLIQMALVSLCFALVCASVSRSVSGRAARLTALFFGLYPAHMAFASNCTKDVLFSSFFALFAALCLEEIAGGGLPRRRRIMQIASGVLACLMRNNMIYAMAAWAVLLLLAHGRYLRLALWSVLVIALSQGMNAGLAAATDAQGGKLVEMLSVPVQQLARARLYAPECFDGEQLALMDAVFCTEECPYGVYTFYDPTLADPIKNRLDDEKVRENLASLAGMWLSVGARCPEVYLEAFLHLALPSLYPYGEYGVTPAYIELEGDGALTAPFGLPPMVRPQRFEQARSWLSRVFSTGADDVPVVRWLFNTGAVYWLLFLFFLDEAYCGRWDRALVHMLAVLLWGTYLLGPVMQGRYLYPFICVLPLFVLRPKVANAGEMHRAEAPVRLDTDRLPRSMKREEGIDG